PRGLPTNGSDKRPPRPPWSLPKRPGPCSTLRDNRAVNIVYHYMCVNAVKREKAIGKVQEGRGKLTPAPMRFHGKCVGTRRVREIRLAQALGKDKGTAGAHKGAHSTQHRYRPYAAYEA